MSAGTDSKTIGDVLIFAATEVPDALAVVIDEQRCSYGDLYAAALGRVDDLISAGVLPGDRIGLLMPNCMHYVEYVFATALIGAVAVPINTRSQDVELSHVVRHAGLRLVVTVPPTEFEPDLADVVRRSSVRDIVQPRVAEAIELPFATSAVARTTDATDVAVLLYTSGTTAAPKGCAISHRAIVQTGIARFAERDPEAKGPVWTPCPLFHVGALVPLVGCVATMRTFVSCRRFEADRSLAALACERIETALPLFPAFTDAMMDHHAFGTADLGSLRTILATGPLSGVRRAQREFAPAKLMSAYGMTELCGVAASSSLDDSDEDRLIWDGRPFDGIEMAIVDPETGQQLAAGAVGEIVARGYCVFDYYYDDPEATARAFDNDGWFHTGDMGLADATGRIAFRGRYKDMLKVGGENVSALEVETFLGSHPAVRRVEVVGAPDARLEEVVAAFVELEPGATASVDELIEHCSGSIARFKVPRHVVFVGHGSWPMSATKVDKVALRKRINEIVEATH